MPPIHIAHVVHSFGTGGLENGIVNLINMMDPSNFRFSVFSLTPEHHSLERITRKKIFFREFYKKPGNDLRVPFQLARLLRKDKVDVIHTHNWSTYLEGFLAAKMVSVPIIIHGEHGFTPFDRRRRILAYKLCMQATDQILTVSNDLRSRLVKKARDSATSDQDNY